MMISFSEHSKAVALVLVFAASIAARADTLVTKDATSWGTVISLKNGSITFRSGCTGADTQIAWSSVLIVQFDHNCKSGPVKLPTAPLLICKKALVHIFKIRISGQYLYLTSVSMAPDSDLRGVPYGKRGWIRLKKNKVDSIQPTDICPSSISELDSFPKGVCFEPEQWAVNWSTEPVFNNQIFTKGFAIYVSSESSLHDEVTERLRVAFGTALTLWASTLQEHKNELPADLRSYVDRSTSSSRKYVLYTPPQVVRVSCKENALLIVNWVTKRDKVFPRGQGYVARAQLQGRTILLNANEYQFGYRPDFLKPLAADVINLISVFVHELGHCLGLPDDSADPESVMNPNHVASMINETVSPSPGDFRNFVRSLRASVSGTSPGFFDVKDCAGLVVKKRTGAAKG